MFLVLPVPECTRHSAQPGLPKTGPQAIHWTGGEEINVSAVIISSCLFSTLCVIYIYTLFFFYATLYELP